MYIASVPQPSASCRRVPFLPLRVSSSAGLSLRVPCSTRAIIYVCPPSRALPWTHPLLIHVLTPGLDTSDPRESDVDMCISPAAIHMRPIPFHSHRSPLPSRLSAFPSAPIERSLPPPDSTSAATDIPEPQSAPSRGLKR